MAPSSQELEPPANPGRFIDPGLSDHYLHYVKSLPATIMKSGLLNAMAMEAAGIAQKKENGQAHKCLYGHVENWLLEGWETSPLKCRFPVTLQKGRLLEALLHSKTGERDYIRAQAESLAYLEWLKKFAVAFLEQSKDSA
jgi:CRISPR-associated protein Cmr5